MPLTHSLSWIIASVFFVTCPIYFLWKKEEQKSQLPPACIQSIIQTTPQREALTTECLAEILTLSADHPSRFDSFSIKKAKELLQYHPVISSAQIKKLSPDTLFVNYTVRQPLASIEDLDNVVVDTQGYPFPSAPFFSSKNLPQIYLGLSHVEDPFPWNAPFSTPPFLLALRLIDLFHQKPFSSLFMMKRIDVSHAFSDSYGRREIVLILEDFLTIAHPSTQQTVTYCLPWILRLSSKDYLKELEHFLQLREELVNEERKTLSSEPSTPLRRKEKVIDLRISSLAFIDS